jgi:hypothetical protein
MTRSLSLLALCAAASLVGCQDYFGTNEGYEEGGAPFAAGGAAGSADFEIVDVSPNSAGVGDSVTLVTVSEEGAPVTQFTIDDFWFCTWDGESAMIETGGEEYEGGVDAATVAELPDVDVDLSSVEGELSLVTFQVPAGTLTGEGIVFIPSGAARDFSLGID